GLGGAAVPIIIHLLSRRRYRLRDWAAMEFIRQAFLRNKRRLQIEQLILLAVRCLLALLLAVALARFTGCAAMRRLATGDGSQATVFVLDTSCSMGQKLGGAVAFDLASADLIEQLNELGDGHYVAIRLTSDPADRPFFALNRVGDRPSLITRIQTLSPGDGRGGLAGALSAAAKTLDAHVGSRRLIVLSDFRRTDLARDRSAALSEAFGKLIDADVDVIAMDYGREARNNVTVEKLELVDKFAVAAAPARIGLTVQNNSPETARDVAVTVRLRTLLRSATDDQAFAEAQLPTQTINLIEPGSQRRVEFNVTVGQVGSAGLSASLGGDELPGDNQGHLILQVRPALDVLIVDGRPNAADPLESESFFFAAAADPSGTAEAGVRAIVIAADDLQSIELDDYDVVALLDVAEFQAEFDEDSRPVWPMLAALEQFVSAGGGLAVYTGPQVNLTFYNGPVYANGLGLSPLPIGPPTGDPAARRSFVRLDPQSIDGTGFLRTFGDEGRVLTDLVRFFAFTPAQDIIAGGDDSSTATGDRPAVSPPKILARFTDDAHSPAVAWRAFGQGQVAMVYSTASLRWNDWADDQPRGIYVAPIQDMIYQLARRRHTPTSPVVGEPIAHAPSAGFADAAATLKLPSFPATDMIALAPAKADKTGRKRFTSEHAGEAGVYTLSLALPDGSGQNVLIARNVDPAEGLLAPARRDGLRRAWGSDDFTYIRRSLAQPVEEVRATGKEKYWLWIMAMLIGLVAVETYLAQRFGHYAPSETGGQGGRPE
ncbi:MAG: BatA domain-containing protein, partial [Planctomycetota bacterium]